jgi:creatinine amidohydrolase
MAYRNWSEMTAPDVQSAAQAGAIVVLPIGAIEQHGPHLPVGTDCLIGQACAEAALAGARAQQEFLLLPHISYGLSVEHDGYPGTVTLSPQTVLSILTEVGASVALAGVKHLVIVTGHGGNEHIIEVAAREIRRTHKLGVFCVELFRCMDGLGVSDDDIHAGQFETSVMMHLRPELVGESRIGEGFARSLELWAKLADHSAYTTQTWLTADVAVDGVVGAPHTATRALGEGWLARLSERLACTLDAIAKTVNS